MISESGLEIGVISSLRHLGNRFRKLFFSGVKIPNFVFQQIFHRFLISYSKLFLTSDIFWFCRTKTERLGPAYPQECESLNPGADAAFGRIIRTGFAGRRNVLGTRTL